MALKTPLYDLKRFPNVYEPREDTFLFLDSLELDVNALKDMNPDLVLEVGSGCGVIISAVAAILQNNCSYFTTDINFEACLATANTAKLNNVPVEASCMDLFLNFREELFDLIFFNPPYVVTDGEMQGTGLNRAWAGGKSGREVIDTFLKKLPSFLNKHGICYMIILKENDPVDIMMNMQCMGFKSKIVLDRKILGEHLYVIKFYKI